MRYNRNGKITLQSEKVGLKIVFIFFQYFVNIEFFVFLPFLFEASEQYASLTIGRFKKTLISQVFKISHKYKKISQVVGNSKWPKSRSLGNFMGHK